LQISQLQEQHPPKSHDKPSPPVTTRQSARKHLFNATPHFKKPDTSTVDDILLLDILLLFSATGTGIQELSACARLEMSLIPG
jgi:hypothetical protein